MDWPEAHGVEIRHRRDFGKKAPKVTTLDHKDIFDPPYGIRWDFTPALHKEMEAENKANVKVLDNFLAFGVCADMGTSLNNTKWTVVKSWDYFAPLLLLNKNHENVNRILRPFSDQLVFVLANVAQIVKLTQPFQDTIAERRSELFRSYQARGQKVLGIHLRTTHPEIPVTEALLDTMVKCSIASGHKIWYLATEGQASLFRLN